MRRPLALLAGLIVLIVANWTIYQREKLVEDGRIVLLELAPVDPRSLMQGDYMALDFQLNRKVADRPQGKQDGRVVLALDARNVGSFLRFDDGTPLASNQAVLHYRVREGRPMIATNAFFFQEGEGTRYEAARYGEFRVAPDGEAILTDLRDVKFRGLGNQ